MTAATAKAEASTADREIILTRVLDAPRDLVFKAWSDPEGIGAWWGPRGFTTTTQSMDFRPGGSWRFVMHGPDGTDHPNRIVYEEIIPGERIVYHHHDGSENHPHFDAIITFADRGGRTEVTFRMVLASPEVLEQFVKFGAVEGGEQTLDRLSETVAMAGGASAPGATLGFPTDRELTISRTFLAPRALVFEAFTKPEHIRNWYGLGSMEMTVCEMDPRPGGTWRFVQRDPATGMEFAFSGVVKEIEAPERIVHTELFEMMPGTEYLVTTKFLEHEGRTTIRVRLTYQAPEHRDGHVASGMEAGLQETYRRLDAHLATLVAADPRSRELVLTRMFDAPRDLVFQAWTRSEHVAKWFGPRGFVLAECVHEPRPGGRIVLDMKGPDGTIYPNRGEYDEVVPPERVSCTMRFLGEGGVTLMEGHETVTFEDVGGKTRLTLRVRVPFVAPGCEMFLSGMEAGWSETLDRLREHLGTLRG